MVGLDGNSKIGRLSKAEVRILSIACELVGNPTLICLIDPTEGLDAGGALDVMRVLHAVSKRASMATTVVYNVFSIHEDMFRLIDNIALFVESKLEYHCSVRNYSSRALLTACHLVTQASAVVLDHERNHTIVKRKGDLAVVSEQHANSLLKIIGELDRLTENGGEGRTSITSASGGASGSSPRGVHFAQNEFIEPSTSNNNSVDLYRSTLHQGRSEEHYSLARRLAEPGLPIRYHKSLRQQFTILFLRSLSYHWKNSMYLRMGLFRFMLAGIIIGALVYNAGSKLDAQDLLVYSDGLENDNAYNVTSAMFVLVAMSVVGTAFAVPYLHANAYLLKFEVASGLQTTLASWLSLVLIDIPMYIVAAIIIGAVVYNMISIQGSSVNFFGTIFMVTLTGYSLAAVCAIWFRSKTMATFVFSLLASFCLLFTGYLQFVPQLPYMWEWAANMAFTRWAFESFLIVAFDQAPDGASYLENFSFGNSSSSYCNGWLFMWFVGLQVLVFLGLSPPWYRWRLGTAENIEASDHAKIQADSAAVEKYISEMPSAGSRNSNEIKNALSLYQPPVFSSGKAETTQPSADTAPHQLFSPEEVSPQVVSVQKDMVTTLTFSRLRYTKERIGGGQDVNIESKFRGVSGQVNPGTCCCIVDGANDGTSTLLLQVLGGKCRSVGKTTGLICANDQRLGRDMYYLNVAYVQRGDAPHIATLTVREVLRYAAWLRRTDQHTCASMSRVWHRAVARSEVVESIRGVELIGKTGDVEERVSEVLRLMGLESVADYVVGEVHKIHALENRDSRLKAVLSKIPWFNNRSERTLNGRPMAITPAQLRCLTIGTELVNRPGLIFLEDPIADLEWHDAEQVTQVIRSLANGGRTVLCSMERPTLRIMNMFNEVMMLGSGLLVYSGAMDAASAYFDNIGFERVPGQNDLEYLQDIATDRGKMGVVAGRRGNTLSPDDLADLNRSLANIRAGKAGDDSTNEGIDLSSKRGSSSPKPSVNKHSRNLSPKPVSDGVGSSFFALDEKVAVGSPVHSPRTPGGNDAVGRSRGGVLTKVQTESLPCAVSSYKHTAPIGPTSLVLTHRGFKLLLADKKLIVIHCLQCLAAGVLIGSVYWNMGNGDYQERMSLFAVSYVCLNLFVVDSLEGVYKRKEAFIREAFVDASSFVSYYMSDTSPSLLLYAIGAGLFIAPIYSMSGLRDGVDKFLYFYVIVLASIFCNYSLAYLLSMLTDSVGLCRMVFSGVIIPLQLLMSGYLVLIPTMDSWIQWGSYICPMTYYLAGCFRNEFEDNSDAIGPDIAFSNLADMYDYHTTLTDSFLAVVVFGLIYKLIWLVALKLYTVFKRRAVLRRVESVRKKARKIITAGLRWRRDDQQDGYDADAAMGELEFGAPSMA
eukprot:gene22154-28261_t